MLNTGRMGLANSIMKFGAPGQTKFKQWVSLEDARVERYPHLDKTFLIVNRFGVMPLPDDYNERMKEAFGIRG